MAPSTLRDPHELPSLSCEVGILLSRVIGQDRASLDLKSAWTMSFLTATQNSLACIVKGLAPHVPEVGGSLPPAPHHGEQNLNASP